MSGGWIRRASRKQAVGYPLSDALVLGQGHDGLDVLLGELGHGHALVLAADVIGQDDGGEDGEAVAGVEGAVIVVVVDPGQLLCGVRGSPSVPVPGPAHLPRRGFVSAAALTISSPGLQLSTRSANRTASLERGSRPAATLPGLSCSVILW